MVVTLDKASRSSKSIYGRGRNAWWSRTAREASIEESRLLSSFLALLGEVLVENDPKGAE
jgi:23S rRNA maturation mini-RNase III